MTAHSRMDSEFLITVHLPQSRAEGPTQLAVGNQLERRCRAAICGLGGLGYPTVRREGPVRKQSLSSRARARNAASRGPGQNGFQIALEANGPALVWELDDHVNLPGTPRSRVGAVAGVVCGQARTDVRGEADRELRRLVRVPQHVDESLGELHVVHDSKHAAGATSSKCVGTRRVTVAMLQVIAGEGCASFARMCSLG